MRRTVSYLICILVAFACCHSENSFGQAIDLGVLEDNPGHYAGEPNFWAVRALFEKEGPDWKAFPTDCGTQDCLKITSSYPSEMTWTIAFHGKNLGLITAVTPQEYKWYASVGQQEITSADKVPSVGRRSVEFAGWLDAPVYRP